jgi:hypothetical protein
MNITKKPRQRGSAEQEKKKSPAQKLYPQGLVMSERDLESLVLSLRIGEAHDAAPRLLAISEAFRAIDRGESLDINMGIISRIVDEEKSRSLKRLMKQIMKAAKEGKRGMDAAWRTTVTTFHLGLDCIPDPSGGERLYKQMLKQAMRKKPYPKL